MSCGKLVLALLVMPILAPDRTLQLGDVTVTADHTKANPLTQEVSFEGNVIVTHALGRVRGESMVINLKDEVAQMVKLRWPLKPHEKAPDLSATAASGTYTKARREIDLTGLRIVEGESWLIAERARYVPGESIALHLQGVEGLWKSPRGGTGVSGRTPIRFEAQALTATLYKRRGEWQVDKLVLKDARLVDDLGAVVEAARLEVDLP